MRHNDGVEDERGVLRGFREHRGEEPSKEHFLATVDEDLAPVRRADERRVTLLHVDERYAQRTRRIRGKQTKRDVGATSPPFLDPALTYLARRVVVVPDPHEPNLRVIHLRLVDQVDLVAPIPDGRDPVRLQLSIEAVENIAADTYQIFVEVPDGHEGPLSVR